MISSVSTALLGYKIGIFEEAPDLINLMGKTNKAINLDSNYAEAFYIRGELKMKLDDYRGAIKDLNNALELESNYKNAHLLKAYSNHYLNRFNEALSSYNQAINHQTEPEFAYLNRGLLYLGSPDKVNDNKNLGCNDLSKAGELGLSSAYEFIKECCQSYSMCNYYPLERY